MTVMPYGLQSTDNSPDIQQTIVGTSLSNDDDRTESESPNIGSTRRSKSNKKTRKPRTIYRY